MLKNSYKTMNLHISSNKRITRNKAILKDFNFRNSKIIKLISFPKLKIWRFNKYKNQFINSFFLFYIPRVIRFIAYFQNNKKIKNFSYKTKELNKKRIDVDKWIFFKNKSSNSSFIIYFTSKYLGEVFKNEYKFISSKKKKFCFKKNCFSEKLISCFHNHIKLIKYDFKKKEESKWIRKNIKTIQFIFIFPCQSLSFGNYIFFFDNKNNNIYIRRFIIEYKFIKNLRYFNSKNLVFFFLNIKFFFNAKNLTLLEFFDKFDITKSNIKNIFILRLDKNNFKRKKYHYKLQKYNKNLNIENKLKTKYKKKIRKHVKYSYYVLNFNHNDYIALDFDCIFCFLLAKKIQKIWNIINIDGFIITKKNQTGKKVKENLHIETNDNFFKLTQIVLKNKKQQISIHLNSIKFFLLITGIIGERFSGYLFIDKHKIKNLISYKFRFFTIFNFFKRKLFIKGIKILTIISDPIVLNNLFNSKYFSKILDYILTKIKINKLDTRIINLKNNKKLYLAENDQMLFVKKKDSLQKESSNVININKNRQKCSIMQINKNTVLNLKKIGTLLEPLLENSIKNLKKLAQKKKFILLHSRQIFFPEKKKKKEIKTEKGFLRYYNIIEKNMFCNQKSIFSNKIGFFFCKLRLFFISYKFCFYFLMLRKFFIKEKISQPFWKNKFKKKRKKKLKVAQKKVLNFIFYKKLKKKYIFLVKIYNKHSQIIIQTNKSKLLNCSYKKDKIDF
nr:hypothetical protein Cry52Nrm3_p138 [Cryptomonas curvata]